MVSRVTKLEAKVNHHLERMRFSIDREWTVENGK
jgi:hypothetical protein